jgi:hypothetical protein
MSKEIKTPITQEKSKPINNTLTSREEKKLSKQLDSILEVTKSDWFKKIAKDNKEWPKKRKYELQQIANHRATMKNLLNTNSQLSDQAFLARKNIIFDEEIPFLYSSYSEANGVDESDIIDY